MNAEINKEILTRNVFIMGHVRLTEASQLIDKSIIAKINKDKRRRADDTIIT